MASSGSSGSRPRGAVLPVEGLTKAPPAAMGPKETCDLALVYLHCTYTTIIITMIITIIRLITITIIITTIIIIIYIYYIYMHT